MHLYYLSLFLPVLIFNIHHKSSMTARLLLVLMINLSRSCVIQLSPGNRILITHEELILIRKLQ